MPPVPPHPLPFLGGPSTSLCTAWGPHACHDTAIWESTPNGRATRPQLSVAHPGPVFSPFSPIGVSAVTHPSCPEPPNVMHQPGLPALGGLSSPCTRGRPQSCQDGSGRGLGSPRYRAAREGDSDLLLPRLLPDPQRPASCGWKDRESSPPLDKTVFRNCFQLLP